MESGQDHFQSGLVGKGGMAVDWNAAAIIGHGYAVVVVDNDVNLVAVPSDGFVNAVVHCLEYEMVKPLASCLADIHPGAFANGIEAFKHDDAVCPIIAF
jgi:hypothetical protein